MMAIEDADENIKGDRIDVSELEKILGATLAKQLYHAAQEAVGKKQSNETKKLP
jgi:hypothetical protein